MLVSDFWIHFLTFKTRENGLTKYKLWQLTQLLIFSFCLRFASKWGNFGTQSLCNQVDTFSENYTFCMTWIFLSLPERSGRQPILSQQKWRAPKARETQDNCPLFWKSCSRCLCWGCSVKKDWENIRFYNFKNILQSKFSVKCK